MTIDIAIIYVLAGLTAHQSGKAWGLWALIGLAFLHYCASLT